MVTRYVSVRGDSMGEANGPYTRQLGDNLRAKITDQFQNRFIVYNDHKLVNPDTIIAHVDDVCNDNNLAELDIAIVSNQNGQRSLAIVLEIEEHKHTPKRILGDMTAIMMSDWVTIKNDRLPLENVDIIIGVITKKGGVTDKKAKKIVAKLESNLSEGEWGKKGIRCTVITSYDGVTLIKEVESKIVEILISRGNQ